MTVAVCLDIDLNRSGEADITDASDGGPMMVNDVAVGIERDRRSASPPMI